MIEKKKKNPLNCKATCFHLFKKKKIQTSVKKIDTWKEKNSQWHLLWHHLGFPDTEVEASILHLITSWVSLPAVSLHISGVWDGEGGKWGRGRVWGRDWEPPSLHYDMIFMTQNEWGRKTQCVHKRNSSTKVFYVPVHKARTWLVQQRLPGEKCERRATRPTMHRKLTNCQ